MTRDELAQLMLGDYQQITADEAQRAPITAQPVMGDLAAQAPSPHEIAAARVQRSVQPLGGRLEGAATELPWKLMTDPLKKAQGFIQAGMNTEQFPLQTMAPGSVLNISTDYDPRRRMGDLAAETALNVTGMPMFGTAPAGSLGMSAARQAPGALAEQAPPFYSAVEQAVQASKQSAAPGQQWAGTLRNTPGVKPEEIETLGLGKLFEQPGSVSKQAVLDQIAANKVNVGEVVKGGGVTHKFGTPEEQQTALQRYETARQAVLNNEPRTPRWDEAVREFETSQTALRDIVPGWGRAPGGGEFQVGGDTKFSQYTLPGGENYREMLLTLPEKTTPSNWQVVPHPEGRGFAIRNVNGEFGTTPDGRNAARWSTREGAETSIRSDYAPDQPIGGEPFRSSHYDEPNILAHVRYNDRVIDGKKTLFVEEVQSDWHQAGKRQGYGTEEQRKQAITDQLNALGREYYDLPATAAAQRSELTDRMNVLHDQMTEVRKSGGVPDAPFKTTWPELAMKRIIREAAEKGYDKVAWTPGSVQAARYPEQLRQHVDNISWSSSGRGGAPNPDGSRLVQAMPRSSNTPLSFTVSKDGIIIDAVDSRAKGQHIEDLFGKDMARQIMEKPGGDIAAKDFIIGAKGMQGFYDEILPATVNKLVKKHGARVGSSTLATENVVGLYDRSGNLVHEFNNRADALEWSRLHPGSASEVRTTTKGVGDVHTLDITPQLRKHALEKGFPYFTVGGASVMGGLAAQDQYQRQGGM